MKPSNPGLIAAISIVGLAFVLTLIVVVYVAKPYFSSMGLNRYGYYQINSTGNTYYEQGNYQAAADEYSKMIDMRPGKEDGYSLRGMAEYKEHHYAQAIADNTKALELLSTREGVQQIGYNPLESYEQKLKYLPRTRASLYFNIGSNYLDKGDNKRAIANYASALELTPNDSDTHYNLAEAYFRLKNYDKALPYCTYNIVHHPKGVDSYTLRARIYSAKGDVDKAIADTNSAISLDPGNIDSYFTRSAVYEDAHQYAKARDSWKGLSSRFMHNSYYWATYAWTEYLAGDIPNSIIDSRRAIDLDPNAPFAGYNLGLCYAVKNDWKQAEPIYRRAIAHKDPASHNGGLDDINNALKKQPNNAALKKAKLLLETK